MAEVDQVGAEAFDRRLQTILAVRCLRTANFAQPVLVVWYTRVGVSAAGVLWLASFYSTAVILAELPSGVVSDTLGRARTLRWAFLALGSSLVITSYAEEDPTWLLGLSMLLRAAGLRMYGVYNRGRLSSLTPLALQARHCFQGQIWRCSTRH